MCWLENAVLEKLVTVLEWPLDKRTLLFAVAHCRPTHADEADEDNTRRRSVTTGP